MEKLKWKYDVKNKQWYTRESVPYANDSFTIRKEESEYVLKGDYFTTYGRFKKISSAKTVANLLKHG